MRHLIAQTFQVVPEKLQNIAKKHQNKPYKLSKKEFAIKLNEANPANRKTFASGAWDRKKASRKLRKMATIDKYGPTILRSVNDLNHDDNAFKDFINRRTDAQSSNNKNRSLGMRFIHNTSTRLMIHDDLEKLARGQRSATSDLTKKFLAHDPDFVVCLLKRADYISLNKDLLIKLLLVNNPPITINKQGLNKFVEWSKFNSKKSTLVRSLLYKFLGKSIFRFLQIYFPPDEKLLTAIATHNQNVVRNAAQQAVIVSAFGGGNQPDDSNQLPAEHISVRDYNNTGRRKATPAYKRLSKQNSPPPTRLPFTHTDPIHISVRRDEIVDLQQKTEFLTKNSKSFKFQSEKLTQVAEEESSSTRSDRRQRTFHGTTINNLPLTSSSRKPSPAFNAKPVLLKSFLKEKHWAYSLIRTILNTKMGQYWPGKIWAPVTEVARQHVTPPRITQAPSSVAVKGPSTSTKSETLNLSTPPNTPTKPETLKKTEKWKGKEKTSPLLNAGTPQSSPLRNAGTPKTNSPIPVFDAGTPKSSPLLNAGTPKSSPLLNAGTPKSSPLLNAGTPSSLTRSPSYQSFFRNNDNNSASKKHRKIQRPVNSNARIQLFTKESVSDLGTPENSPQKQKSPASRRTRSNSTSDLFKLTMEVNPQNRSRTMTVQRFSRNPTFGKD